MIIIVEKVTAYISHKKTTIRCGKASQVIASVYCEGNLHHTEGETIQYSNMPLKKYLN
jgi:hypothetical protein